MPVDWSHHRSAPGLLCRFTPREIWRGNRLRPELREYIGCVLRLRAEYRMDEEDPYPGEWALTSAKDGLPVFGRAWIASGDVTMVDVL